MDNPIQGLEPVIKNVANCELLNFREAPTLKSKIIAELSAGTEVFINKQINPTWSQVTVKLSGNKVDGYVMTKFLEEVY